MAQSAGLLPWIARGFCYLVAIIDWYSRKVLSWRLSNTMEASFCVDCLEEALRLYGRPEVFNSDQGAQFTADAFTRVLKREGITISMDGRGRAFDNIFVERYSGISLRNLIGCLDSGLGVLLRRCTYLLEFRDDRGKSRSRLQ